MRYLSLLALFLASALPALVAGRRPVKEYVIDLDAPPGHRYDALLPDFNSTVWSFWETLFANDAVLRDALFALSDIRGRCLGGGLRSSRTSSRNPFPSRRRGA